MQRAFRGLKCVAKTQAMTQRIYVTGEPEVKCDGLMRGVRRSGNLLGFQAQIGTILD
jgi:hypothetical protein